jgi:hypothetical protein
MVYWLKNQTAMKKAIFILMVLIITLSFSCRKDKTVSTVFSGQVFTNGTEDIILMSNELPKPQVDIYHVTDPNGLLSGSGFEFVTSTMIDKSGNFSITLDLLEDDTYFYGVSGLDETYYDNGSARSWFDMSYSDKLNLIKPGQINNIKIYVSTDSWVIPRFINSNPDPNNNDVFNYVTGIGPGTNGYIIDSSAVLYFDIIYGKVDSLAPWIFKTWSGKQLFGTNTISNSHHVRGKLTRNGVTNDVTIPYNALPFDTSVVIIRY